MNLSTELTFIKELWMRILDLEDFIRDHYIKEIEEEIYNPQLKDDERHIPF